MMIRKVSRWIVGKKSLKNEKKTIKTNSSGENDKSDGWENKIKK